MVLFKECKIKIDIHHNFNPPKLKKNEVCRHIVYKNPEDIISKNTIDNFFAAELIIEKVILFSGAPKRPLTSIHIDGHSYDSEPTGAINFVFPNCKLWEVQWFKCNTLSSLIQTDNTANFIKFDDKSCQIIQNITSYKSFLMRVDIPHRAVNYDENEMHCLSLRFTNNNFYKLLNACNL